MIRNGEELPKDATITSQLSEYDNVPYLPDHYYTPPVTETYRRIYDPTYDIHNDQPKRYPKKSVQKLPILRENTPLHNPIISTQFPDDSSQTLLHDYPKLHQFPTSTLSSTRSSYDICKSKTDKFESHRIIMARSPSFLFYILVFLAEVLLFGVLILSLIWAQVYGGGFAWREDVTLQFNLHPVLMITGFIFLMGHSLLVYRLFTCCNKIASKILHTILHLMAVPCIVVGTIAVFDNHNLRNPPIPNLYSLHSWLGLITIGLFGLQLFFGFFIFWMLLICERATANFRASVLPMHSAMGLITFMLAVATCVTGLTEKAIFGLKDADGKSIYKDLPVEAYVYNAIGTGLAGLAILIPLLVGVDYFKNRKEEQLSAHL